MNIKRLLATALLLAGAACAARVAAPPASSGKIVVIQLAKKPTDAIALTAFAENIKKAGAPVVVIDMLEQRDPTTIAVETVQTFSGKVVDATSLQRDEKTGQLKLDVPADKIGTEFAQTLNVPDSSPASFKKVRPDITG